MTKSKLLFVCGFPSGGTDLTKTILNVHPDIYINGEMPFLKSVSQLGYSRNTQFTDKTEIVAFQNTLEKLDPWNNLENIKHDFSNEIKTKPKLTLEDVLKICFSENRRCVWGNKTPQNTENIDLLLDLFPNAYFLIITRDVRDICLSWQKKWGKDMTFAAAKWAKRMKKGWSVTRAIQPDRYLYVKFEDILSNTEKSCSDICDFLQIEFSERMLEHHKYTSDIIDGKINYGQAIEKRNKKKWKDNLSCETVRRIEEIAFNTMKVFDYQVEHASGQRGISFWETLSGVWNDFWALLLTGNNASQQNTARLRLKEIAFELRKQLLSVA